MAVNWVLLSTFTLCAIAGIVYSLAPKNKFPRLFGLAVLNVILIGIIFAIAPQQAPVTLYKLSLVTLAGLIGYWLDRALFPYARPDQFIEQREFKNGRDHKISFVKTIILPDLAWVFSISLLRRAVIIGCAMLAMGLGA
jgi:predicted membrane channel-forming protein YqfA (hemolysin III family)